MGSFFKNVLGPVLDVGAVVAAPFTAGTSLAWLPSALGAGGAVAGMLGNQNAQNQAGQAAQQNTDNEGALLTGIVNQIAPQQANLAGDLLNDQTFIQPLLNALTGATKTIQSNIGGVGNPGALIQDLMGSNLTGALQGAAATKASRLTGASGILGNVAQEYLGAGGAYGNLANRAAGTAQGLGGQYGGLFDSLFSAVNRIGSGNPGGNNPGLNTGGISDIPIVGVPPPQIPPVDLGGIGVQPPPPSP